MGNLNSTWSFGSSRNNTTSNQQEPNQENNTNITTVEDTNNDNTLPEIEMNTPNNTIASELDSNSRATRYSFRQTIARLSRTSRTSPDPINTNIDTNTSNVNSDPPRRRRRPSLEELQSQRPRLDRIEDLNIERIIQDQDSGEPSMYFYFTLPNEVETTERVEEEDMTEGRRRSTRLQRAAEYMRGRTAQLPTNSSTTTNSSSTPSQTTEINETLPADTSVDRPMVLVRIRQLSNDPPTPTSPNNNTSTSMFQWTIYFMLPSSMPFNTLTIQQTLALLQSILATPNSYEELLRWQDMMGAVSRGVSKESIERDLPIIESFIGACTICLEGGGDCDEKGRTLPCGHSFHVECIDTWLLACNTCPLCRVPPIVN